MMERIRQLQCGCRLSVPGGHENHYCEMARGLHEQIVEAETRRDEAATQVKDLYTMFHYHVSHPEVNAADCADFVHRLQAFRSPEEAAEND